MNRSSFESIIGAFVLIFTVVLIYYLSIYLKKDSKQYYPVDAYFENIIGISIGSQVTISGIKIGEVYDTSFDHEKRAAKVKMCIQENIKIPDDSFAHIVSNGIVGDKLIKIELGGSDNILNPGSEFLYTQSSYDLESLINKFIS